MLPPLQSWAGVKIISLSLVVLFSQCSFNNNTQCSIGLFDRKIFILFNSVLTRLLLIFCHVQPAGNISNYWKHLHNISPLHLNRVFPYTSCYWGCKLGPVNKSDLLFNLTQPGDAGEEGGPASTIHSPPPPHNKLYQTQTFQWKSTKSREKTCN